MVQQNNLDPFANPRAFYASELRRLRAEAGLTQSELAHRVCCSPPYIGQFEQMIRAPQIDISKMMDDVLGSGEHLWRLAQLARRSPIAPYFVDAAALEPTAKTISEYSPMVVPGLLQTELYARAVTLVTLRLVAEAELEGYVDARIVRQKTLFGTTAPFFWVVMHEAARRIPLGGFACMREQVTHVVAMALDRRVIVQVLPFAASAHAFVQESFRLMTFPDGPVPVYAEALTRANSSTRQKWWSAERFQKSYDLVRGTALSPVASLDLLESMAKDYSTT